MQTCLLCLHGDHLVAHFNSGIDKIISRNEQSSLSIILLRLNWPQSHVHALIFTINTGLTDRTLCASHRDLADLLQPGPGWGF